MSTRDQDRREHGQKVHPVQQRLLGAMTKNLYGKPMQPMHAVQAHAQKKSHHRCSTGHWIVLDGSAPRELNTPMTPGVTSGAEPNALYKVLSEWLDV